jgi:hypothetical protein
MAVSNIISNRILYGRDRGKTRLGLLLGGLLFLSSYLFWGFPGVSEAAYDLFPIDVIGGGLALLVLVAGGYASQNDGVLISWLLVFLPVLGATLHFAGVGLQTPDSGEQIAFILAIPLVSALLLGTGGYLLGRGIYRLRRSAGATLAR